MNGVRRPMSAAEYRVVLHRLGLDPMSASRLPSVTAVESEGWARGEAPVPEEVADVLRRIVRAGITPDELDRVLREMPRP